MFKNSLVVAFFMILNIDLSVCMEELTDLSSCTKNSNESSQNNTWSFLGDFKKTSDSVFWGMPNRDFSAYNSNDTDYIGNISLYGYENGTISIGCFSEEIRSEPSGLRYALKNFADIKDEEHVCSWFSYKGEEEPFLHCLYQYNLIPNFVIDRLLKELDWEDFRLNGPLFLESILKEKGESHHEEKFHELAISKLFKIKNQKRQQECATYLIKNLPEYVSGQNIIPVLSNYVTDPNISGYDDVQFLLSKLLFAKGEGAENAILPLLRIKNRDLPQTNQLNTFVQYMLLGDKIKECTLLEQFKNLEATPERMIHILSHVAQQNQDIERLKKKIRELEKK